MPRDISGTVCSMPHIDRLRSIVDRLGLLHDHKCGLRLLGASTWAAAAAAAWAAENDRQAVTDGLKYPAWKADKVLTATHWPLLFTLIPRCAMPELPSEKSAMSNERFYASRLTFYDIRQFV